MVGRCYNNRINLLLLFEHLAEIGMPLGLAVCLLQLLVGLLLLQLLRGRGSAPSSNSPRHSGINKGEVYIREGDNIFAAFEQFYRVGRALPPAADYGNINFIAGGLITRPAEHVSRHDHGSEGRSGCA